MQHLRSTTRGSMDSDGLFSSDSELSQHSDWSLDSDPEPVRSIPRRIRRESVASVCTQPEEDAYVMVLQNRLDMNTDLKHSSPLRDVRDVTFLVGHDGTPVHGVRSLISAKCSLLDQLIESYEKGQQSVKVKTSSPFRKTFSKLKKLTPRRSSSRQNKSLVIPMETFDVTSFQRLMTYIHNGTMTVDASTVLGLLNAAYMFELPEVRKACWDFALGCVVRPDNLQDVLESARWYADHKMTTQLIKTLRRFIDDYPDLLSQSKTLADLAEEVFRKHQVLSVDVDKLVDI